MTTTPKKSGQRRSGQRTRRHASRDNLVGAFDMSIRFLLQHRPQDFISFGLGNRPVQVLGPIAGALPALGRDIDGGYLALLLDEARRMAVHVELHRRHQAVLALGHDILEAQTRIFKREGVQVLSLVFDLYGDEHGPVWSDEEVVFGVELCQGRASRCVYRRVNLRGLDWRELLGLPIPTLWSLVPLSRGGAHAEAFVAARDAITGRAGLGAVEQAEHLAVLSFLAEAEGVAEAIVREYIVEEVLMQSTLYESIIQKGIDKGMATGMAKGEARKAAKVILKLLRKRLGEVDQALVARLDAEEDPATLDRWLDAALELTGADSARLLCQQIRDTPPRG